MTNKGAKVTSEIKLFRNPMYHYFSFISGQDPCLGRAVDFSKTRILTHVQDVSFEDLVKLPKESD